MATKTDILRFVSGGINAIVGPSGGDGPSVDSGTAASPATAPEQTRPEPQLKDREPFLQRVTQTQILGGTAALIAAIGIVAVARR